ncbi:MAG: MASE1 domain-containing protein, partial [Polaromonas sp.]
MQYQPLQSHAPSQAAPLTSPSLLLTAVLLGFVYAILSTPAAYTSNADTLAAIIWPAPAVACALIWRLPYRQWWPFVVAIFVAMIFVGGRDPLSLGADMAFAVLNIVQVVLYTFAGRRFVSGPGAIDTTAKLARYMLFLPLLVNGVTAAIGATIGMVTKHTNWMDEWRVMLVGNGLAILVLLPALLAWFPQHRPRSPATPDDSPWPAVIAAVLGVLLLMVSALVPGFPAEVMRALLSLVLVWAAIQGGIRAASLGLLAAAVAGIGLALSGHGAYGVLPGQGGVWELQVDLAGLAVLSFFVAITVNERQKINLRLERARRFETMGFLTGGIAHDFNNILGAVGG